MSCLKTREILFEGQEDPRVEQNDIEQDLHRNKARDFSRSENIGAAKS